MATKGRKPLPTALKKLEGDRGKGRRPINEHEPTPPKGAPFTISWRHTSLTHPPPYCWELMTFFAQRISLVKRYRARPCSREAISERSSST